MDESAKPCALVVDDEVLMRRLLVRIIEEDGWRAVAAASGPEALAAFKPGRFALVILDVDLKGVSDGIALAKVFRAQEPGLRIQMISGQHLSEDRVRNAGLGVPLRKPFDLDDISRLLRPGR